MIEHRARRLPRHPPREENLKDSMLDRIFDSSVQLRGRLAQSRSHGIASGLKTGTLPFNKSCCYSCNLVAGSPATPLRLLVLPLVMPLLLELMLMLEPRPFTQGIPFHDCLGFFFRIRICLRGPG